MIAFSSGAPVSMCVSIFSIMTAALSTRMPTASANPPRVMTLIDCPSACRAMSELRIESGIEVSTMTVRRLAALHHDDDDGLLALNYYGICLHTAREARHADVAQMDPGITLLLDRDVVEGLDLQRVRVGQDDPVG